MHDSYHVRSRIDILELTFESHVLPFANLLVFDVACNRWRSLLRTLWRAECLSVVHSWVPQNVNGLQFEMVQRLEARNDHMRHMTRLPVGHDMGKT